MSSNDQVTPPDPKAKKSDQVHPFARKVADLLSPMSLNEQERVTNIYPKLIYSALLLSFPISFVMNDIFISIFSICAACAVSLVLFAPNWRHQPTPGLRWANEGSVYSYYEGLKAERKPPPPWKVTLFFEKVWNKLKFF